MSALCQERLVEKSNPRIPRKQFIQQDSQDKVIVHLLPALPTIAGCGAASGDAARPKC